jgi:hypothetical protein
MVGGRESVMSEIGKRSFRALAFARRSAGSIVGIMGGAAQAATVR